MTAKIICFGVKHICFGVKYIYIKVKHTNIALLSFSVTLHAQQDNVKLHQLFDKFYKEANAIDPVSAIANAGFLTYDKVH